jgi:predicted ATP-grasp superfamily ATP-dependent carboligase
MRRVLLTGARSAAALELARLFHASGWRVVVAESLAAHPARFSRVVSRSYPTPWPNRDPDGFVDALLDVVRRERIDLLIPTCEEIFYVAHRRDRLAPCCTVFAEDRETLRRLHSKWLFAETAKRHGLPVPPTTLLTSPSKVQAALAGGRELVLKPAYSRFASQTLIRPTADAAARIDVSERRPWVAQVFVPGRLVCTYSVAHRGRVTAHAAYAAEYKFGLGAAVAFASVEHPATTAWVEAFVRAEGFTGQIAFDFIEAADGAVYAIECNPRATSGVHLFADTPAFVDAFLGARPGVLHPRGGRTVLYAMLMAGYAPKAAHSWAGLRRWAGVFTSGRDVFFRRDDPLPFLGQFATFAALAWRGRGRRIPLSEAATLDIEWNGD